MTWKYKASCTIKYLELFSNYWIKFCQEKANKLIDLNV